MKRYGRKGRKIKWNARAIVGFSLAVLLILAATQIPNFMWFWFWGPDSGYRSAGFTSGHFERKHPAILRGMPMVGLVMVGSGERLVFDYDLELEEGTASFSVWKWPSLINRPHMVGPRMIRKSGRGQIEFTPNGFGLYRIFMYAHRMQGAVRVDWYTEDRRAFADNGRGG